MSSTAEEMLNNLTDDEIAAYTATPDDERHIVVDENRKITVPDELKRIAVQYDHNIETVTFDCIRYWDGHDMSTMHVYINYMLNNKALGSYLAEDVTVDPDDENIIHFTWTISRNVTQVVGPVTFLVCVKRVDEDGNEVNHWNSELNKEMFVNQGLECGEPIAEDYPDIIEKILTKLENQENYPAWRRWTDASGNYTDESGMPYGVKLMDESNNASGSWSIAGGYNTTASGMCSASLGNSTTASGVGSVAFGTYSLATGDNSVAFGRVNIATGNRSVSFGENTQATKDDQLVIGRYNTPDSDDENAVQHAFIIGNGYGPKEGDPSYKYSNALTVDWDGNLDIAKSIRSLNMGCSTTGGGLIAMGGGNTASGSYSVAIGAGCRATGQYSLAMGGSSTASGFCSVAVGGGTSASNSYSVSIGVSNTASANNSITIGGSNTANGAYSAAIGYNCKALSPYSMAFGTSCTVGNETNTQLGMNSVAIGASCNAQSSCSMAFGATCSVSGDYSFAGGAVCHARGAMSVSLGRNSDSYGDCSVSIGDHLIAVGESQTAFGKYNVDETDFDFRNLFVVGNGTDNNNRSNAMAVDFAGNLNMNRDVVANAFGDSPISLVELSNRIGYVEEQLATLVTPEGSE